MRGLSLVAASGVHSSSRCTGLPLSRSLLLRSTGSRRAGSAIVAHGPRCSAACGIFPARAGTRVPCIGRQIINHCATREALLFLKKNFFFFNVLAALGLRCCAQAFSSCGEPGLLFVVVRGFLIVVASLVAEHGL